MKYLRLKLTKSLLMFSVQFHAQVDVDKVYDKFEFLGENVNVIPSYTKENDWEFWKKGHSKSDVELKLWFKKCNL